MFRFFLCVLLIFNCFFCMFCRYIVSWWTASLVLLWLWRSLVLFSYFCRLYAADPCTSEAGVGETTKLMLLCSPEPVSPFGSQSRPLNPCCTNQPLRFTIGKCTQKYIPRNQDTTEHGNNNCVVIAVAGNDDATCKIIAVPLPNPTSSPATGLPCPLNLTDVAYLEYPKTRFSWQYLTR